MGAAYIVNTVIERIDGLEAHLDRVLSRLLQGLHQLEGKLDDMAKICKTTLTPLFRKCWNRGVAFTLGQVLVLLYLDHLSEKKKPALRSTCSARGL